MKTITIKQPWANLIVEGIKDVENRTWPTKFRGRVLIHAGMTKTIGPMVRYLNQEQQKVFRTKIGYYGLDFLEPLGAIIGSVEIVDCIDPIDCKSVWGDKAELIIDKNGMIQQGKRVYNWVLANPIKFPEPIPAKGKLSFWDYPFILDENNLKL